jgi:hypothetical protein
MSGNIQTSGRTVISLPKSGIQNAGGTVLFLRDKANNVNNETEFNLKVRK